MPYKNPKSGIYRITCLLNNKIYIGSATDIQNRKATHFSRLRLNTHANIHLQRVYNKHGSDSLKYEVIHYCKIDELLIWEQHFIDYYQPELNINKIVEKAPMTGRHHSRETRNKLRKSSSKECHQYTLKGVFIKTWVSVTTAADVNDINRGDLAFCCRGGVQSCGGYQWSYFKSPTMPLYSNKSQKPIVLLRRGKVVKEWFSLSECARYYGVTNNMIFKHLKGKVVKKPISLKYKI